MPNGYSEAEAKSNLIRITQHRFRLFEEKFLRQPSPHEPIFFDESQDHPVAADNATARRQLTEAARTLGVSVKPVLKFLGLDV